MTLNRFCQIVLTIAALAVAGAAFQAPKAQVAAGASLEESVPAGNNYDKAEFKLWYPTDIGPSTCHHSTAEAC